MKRLTLFIIISLLVLNGFAKDTKDREDPFYKSFYEVTRLIMSKDEIQIYKHLPDIESKKEFIEEFWKKRDPTPGTEENEMRTEYAQRIAYANRWFNERRGKGRGWDTERGRILLQLGVPDQREFGEAANVGRSGRLASTMRLGVERWIYYQHRLYLQFTGDRNGFGVYKMSRPPAQLRQALDEAKLRMDLGKKPKKNYFKFDADFKPGSINIKIPVKRINFEEKSGMMNARFRVNVFIYYNYRKIAEISETKTFEKSQEELLDLKELDFTIPFELEDNKGTYFFDTIITDELGGSKYRSTKKIKF